MAKTMRQIFAVVQNKLRIASIPARAVYQYYISGVPDGDQGSWYVDLTASPQTVNEGEHASPDFKAYMNYATLTGSSKGDVGNATLATWIKDGNS